MPPRVTNKTRSLRKTFIREWREYRGLSQDQLVERVRERVSTFSKSTLSRIENTKQGYTQPILEALAWALDCEPADLTMRDPTKDEAIWSIYENLKKADADTVSQAAGYLDALLQRARSGGRH